MYDKVPIVCSSSTANDGDCSIPEIASLSQPLNTITPIGGLNMMMDATCNRQQRSSTSSSAPSSLSAAFLQPQRHGFFLSRHRQVGCILSVAAAFAFGVAVGIVVPALRSSDTINSATDNELQPSIAGAAIAFRISRASEQPPQRSVHEIRTTTAAVNRSAAVAQEVDEDAANNDNNNNNNDERQSQKPAAHFPMFNEFGFLNNSRQLHDAILRISSSSPPRPIPASSSSSATASTSLRIERLIDDDIFWGATVEGTLPAGFRPHETAAWTDYLRTSIVTKIEPGCGRMQNRLVHFHDGHRACARYRQNTDQIQGELFSFYLGRLLNITNLAPSAAVIVDVRSPQWQRATGDIVAAQWRSQRPVVLTQWLPDLEPARIPAPFRPLARHLNRIDVQSIVRAADQDRKRPAAVLRQLVELAQWSDLIVFDYLIANLDRVVNNLYNYQWNADIMAAPAHNLARQRASALLVFLDNESGLLHGYRLLQKYEAYHGVMLDNLCVFRRSTIEALQRLQRPPPHGADDADANDDAGDEHEDGIATHLQRVFEATTGPQLRDVLPALPRKSVRILGDRIERVLAQVRKCRAQFASR